MYLTVLGKRVAGMETLSSTSVNLRMPEHFGVVLSVCFARVKQLRKGITVPYSLFLRKSGESVS